MVESYARHIARSLELLETESPWHRRRLAQVLDGRTVAVVLDDELILIAVDVEPGPPYLVVAASGDGAVRLMHGERTLEDALWAGTVAARGSVAALQRGATALSVYLHGLIRCPSAAQAIADFEATVAAQRSPRLSPDEHVRSERWHQLE